MKVKILLLEDIPTDADTILVQAKINLISKFPRTDDCTFLYERIDLPANKNNSNVYEMDVTISLSKIKGGYLFAALQNNNNDYKLIEKLLKSPDINIEGTLHKGKITTELELKDNEIRTLRNEVERAKLNKLLSKREFEILCLIATGQSVKKIAEQLFLSPSTVATYRARLLEKLNFKSTIDLVLYAIRNGFIN